jgi:hypothetical protein
VWLLYQRYAGKGYTKSHTYYPGCGRSKICTLWTQKGRKFIYDELRKHGILPTMESNRDISLCSQTRLPRT